MTRFIEFLKFIVIVGNGGQKPGYHEEKRRLEVTAAFAVGNPISRTKQVYNWLVFCQGSLTGNGCVFLVAGRSH